MSLINYLGTFDTLTAAWEAYPEGGKEGDYVIVGEEYYQWDKYSTSWSLSAHVPDEATVAEEDYYTPTRSISEDMQDTSEQTNVFLNFLGYFTSMTEAWEVYPEGGKEGDYIIISEQRLWWNKYAQEWDNTIIASSDTTGVEIDVTLPSSCVNPLGKFDSIADAWQKHPEGGKEGDYIQIAEDIYKWDKYLTAWINIENLPSSERLPIVPTFTEDAVDYSDGYINYLGTFESLEQVWLAYPEGGKEGDYVIVDGERYRWNKLTNNWGEVDPDTETPARPIVSIYGDLHVHHDTVIGEKLYAEILKTFTTKRWVLEQGYIGNKDITPTLIMSNIVPDNVTIGVKDGKLVVIGGGTADSISWEDITNKPSWLEEEEGFVTISSEQTIRAHKNFEKGISVQGAPISYDAVKKVWIFDANMLVTGGFAWNSSIDGFKPETITDAVIVDGITLGRTPEGALCVIGDIRGLDEEALQEYLDFNKYVTTNYVKDNYIAINGDQDVEGIKNFANGLKIGNSLITYNAEKNAFILPANLLVEGGVAWDSSIEGFEPKTITDAVMIDSNTLGRNENGEIYVKGGAGGGGSIEYPLTWSGYSSGSYDGSASKNIAIPSLLSQLTNDAGFATSAVVSAMLSDYATKDFVTSKGYITSSALTPYITTDSVNSLLTGYIDKTSIKNYMAWSQKHHVEQNIDSLFDFGVVSTAGNVNSPSTAAYGVVATFPYRNAYGNSIPDLAAQLYFPNGDEATPHLFWRSSIKNSWNNWRTILDSSNYSDYALPITGGTVKGGVDFEKTYGSILTIRDGRYGQSAVISVGYTDWAGDMIKLHIPAAGSYDHYLMLSQYAGATLTMGLTVNGNITIDGKMTASDSFNVGKTNGVLFSIVADWQNVDIISKLWDDNRWDYVKITTPTTYSSNSSINICARGYVEVIGDFLTTGEVTQHSSLVLKDVVDTRFLTLKELEALKPYSFRWRDGRDDKLHAGAVADYVKPILPEVISTDKNDIHSMNYANAAWVVSTSLTPYVSNHEKEIVELKKTVKKQKEEIKILKDKLNLL